MGGQSAYKDIMARALHHKTRRRCGNRQGPPA